MFTGVVGTEEQFTAGLKLDTQVGLCTAAVAAVTRRQGGRLGGNGSIHIGLISLHRCLAQRSHRVKDSRLVRSGWDGPILSLIRLLGGVTPNRGTYQVFGALRSNGLRTANEITLAL